MLEVCVDNIQSAINAEKGGASRLELCSALSEGGLTPTCGMLQIVKKTVAIPIYVMLRTRRGDFVYSNLEIEIMMSDAYELKQSGADGFVFGILNIDGTVNVGACNKILELISPLPATFHRAFDVMPNPFSNILPIIDLGFCRLLTSGQASSAEKGVQVIKKLIQISNNRIIVMAGAGINTNNIYNIIKETGVKEVHASCRIIQKNIFPNHNTTCSMGSADNDFNLLVTDENIVRRIVTMLNEFNNSEYVKSVDPEHVELT